MANSQDIPHKQQDPNDFLMGGGVPSASFLHIGDSVTGTISEQPTLQQQRDFTSGEPKVWDNGDPMMQLVVTLQTEEFDPKIEDDDGRRRVYLKNNSKKAVADAVRKSGAKRLDVGGRLTLRYTANGEAAKRGINPPKLYSAEYVPPDANYLDDSRNEEAAPPRTQGSNGYWSLAQAIEKAGEVGLTKDGLIAELKKKGLSAYNAERDTATVRSLIVERKKASAFSGEVQFKEDDIPFDKGSEAFV